MAGRRRAPLEGDVEADVVVLGAGITGCAAALELARRGARVVALEAGSVASGASGVGLGHVSTGLDVAYSHAVARFGREGAREIWETQREGHARLRELLGEIRDDCGHRAAGGFRLALDRAEGAALAESEDLLREDGFSGEFFDHYMLDVRFGVRGFAAAYWAADDGEVDPLRFVRGLAAIAEAQGATIHEQSPVLDLDLWTRGAEAVTARGRVRAARAFVALEAQALRHVPFFEGRLLPAGSRCLLLEAEPDAALPSPARTFDGAVAWRATDEGLVLVGFDPPPAREAALPAHEDVPRLEAFASSHLCGPSVKPLRKWTATLARSGDGLPLIGPIPDLPAVAACGYGAHGFAYALLGARWAAEAALAGRDPTPERFRAGRRFARGSDPQ